MKKRKILILFIILIIFSFSTHATPEKSKWIRTIFLGSGDDSYYCILVERDQVGSYYTYYILTYFIEFKNDGSIRDKILVKKTKYWTDVPDESNSLKWLTEVEDSTPLNVQKILQDKNIEYSFPHVPPFCWEGLSMKKEGIYLRHKEKEELLTDIEDIKKCIDPFDKYDTFRGYLNEVKFISIHESNKYLYLLIQVGNTDSYDSDFFQFIVPVKKSDYDKAYKKLHEKKNGK